MWRVSPGKSCKAFRNLRAKHKLIFYKQQPLTAHMYSTPQIDQLPKLVAPNLFIDPQTMRGFALDYGFDCIDWSFDLSRLPETPAEASRWVAQQELLSPLEVRYHCPFLQVDIGHEDKASQTYAMNIFRRMIRLVAKARKKYLSLHVGLGHDTTKILSWDATVQNLRELVQFGAEYGVTVALENLLGMEQQAEPV